MGSGLKIKFWGTRGLVSSPAQEHVVFGGNTPCIQLLCNDEIILINSGYGICNLGEGLMQEILSAKRKLNIHLFYTHFHWDHIQGLPFFHPIYFQSTTINIYYPLPVLEFYEYLNVLFSPSYSPFESLNGMSAEIKLHQIQKQLEIGGLRINFCSLDGQNETKSNFAYRFEYDGKSIAIGALHNRPTKDLEKEFIKLAANCNLIVLESLYTLQEIEINKELQAVAIEKALLLAKASQCESALITQHHPLRSDGALLELKEKLVNDPQFVDFVFDFAKEQVVYTLPIDVLVR